MDSLYSPPTPAMIEVAANQILRRNSTDTTRIVGNAWVYRFIKRLPKDSELVKQKPKDKKR